MSNRTRLGGVVVLIALVLVGAAAGNRWSFRLEPVTTRPTSVVPPPPVQRTEDTALFLEGLDERAAGLSIGEFMTYLAVLVALVLVVVTIVHLRRRTREPAIQAPAPHDDVATGASIALPALTVQLPALRRGVQHARHLLDTAATPRDAVTAAWIALEDAAADTGHRRHPAQTPTEFTTTVLDATPADPDAVTTLLKLYQRARFTTHPLTPQDVDAARSCLERLAIAFTPPVSDDRGDRGDRGGGRGDADAPQHQATTSTPAPRGETR
ncbi:DUF4129 domain-containing protein [Oerskovia paurometabola]|uniref:DUF4129 domain-containing protein n=1 Tax=Oerskovia paurometabola TaxID=162170 RepID=UPI0037F59A64